MLLFWHNHRMPCQAPRHWSEGRTPRYGQGTYQLIRSTQSIYQLIRSTQSTYQLIRSTQSTYPWRLSTQANRVHDTSDGDTGGKQWIPQTCAESDCVSASPRIFHRAQETDGETFAISTNTINQIVDLPSVVEPTIAYHSMPAPKQTLYTL